MKIDQCVLAEHSQNLLLNYSYSQQTMLVCGADSDDDIGVIRTFYENGNFKFYMIDRIRKVVLHTNPPNLKRYIEDNADYQVIVITNKPPNSMVELERFVSKYLNDNYWIRKTSIPVDSKEVIL